MRNAPACRTGGDFGMWDFIGRQLLFSVFVKIFRTPNSALRTCSRLLLMICVALLLGCGYHMVGGTTHLPPGLTSMAIPTFTNQTLEPGIEVQFTQGFLREFINDRRIKVVDRGEADSILDGVIKSFNIYSVAYDLSGIATEYQTTVVIDLTLKKPNGEVLWKEQDFSETRWYRTSSSVLITESNKAAAIQEIGRFMAERIRNRVLYDF
ncbi:MAG: LPS assembly lipoprotein LptE [Thermodesulfobacteriota bacterium]